MSTKLQRQATEAHQNYQELVKVLRLGRLAGAMLGQCLFRLKANNAYREAIGAGIETWNDFLKMPEIGLDPREATRAMEIYDEFCIKRGYSIEMLAETGTKALHYLLPMVKDGTLKDEQIGGLLQAGAALPQKSFKEKLHDVRGGERHYEFVLMRRCIETDNLQRVDDITSEQLSAAFPELADKLMPEII